MQNICKTSNVKNIIKIIKKNIVLLQIIKHKRIHSTNIYRQQTYFFLTTQYNLAHTTNTNTTYTREFLYYSLYAFINIHFLFFWFWTFGVQCHVSVALIFSLIHVPIPTSTLQKHNQNCWQVATLFSKKMEPLPSPPAKPPISTSPASNNPNPQTITNTTPINPTPKDIYRGINWILDDADDDDVDDVSTDSKPAVTSTPVFDKKVFQNALKTIVKTDKKLGKYHF